jgi:hypothetical protein
MVVSGAVPPPVEEALRRRFAPPVADQQADKLNK